MSGTNSIIWPWSFACESPGVAGGMTIRVWTTWRSAEMTARTLMPNPAIAKIVDG